MKSYILTNLWAGAVFFVCMGIWANAHGQRAKTIGLESQAYPAGVITTLRGGLEITNQQELSVRVGYNYTYRGDFGVHDNEEGGGPGFSLGYRYYVENELDGFFIGARANLWFLEIDWRDTRIMCGTIPPCFDEVVRGTTDITVFQPTAEIGYNLLSGRSSWMLAPVLGFGWEFNVRTDGEEVGEGSILLGGLNVAYLF